MVEGVCATLGIRFAEPVDGRRRFAAPVPVAGVERVAGEGFGPAAWQAPHPDFPLGDDCLTLNVWSPDADEPLPVLVWVHGGGFIGGTARQPELDGAELAAACRVVVVAIQYRLGAWGFLDLRAEVDDAVTNAGVRDALAALDWVRAHIADFGGDPERIVVDGASAGGGVVGALLAARPAHGRIRGAVLQSPPLATVQTVEQSAVEAARFARLVEGGPAAASPEELVAAQYPFAVEVARRRPGVLVFSPVIDGDFLAGSPEDVLAAGDAEPVPVLAMWNTDEGTAFREDAVVRTDAVALEALTGSSAAELRTRETDWPADAARMRVATDAYFAGPIGRALAGHAAIAPSWVARFDHRTPVLDALGLGASHSAEGPFLFGNLDGAAWAMIAPKGPSEDDIRVMTDLRAVWRRFLHEGATGWSPLEPGERFEHVIR